MNKEVKKINKTQVLDLNNLSIENTILLNSISVNIIDDFNRLSRSIYQATNKT